MMYLKNITIKNFRSIKELISFKIQEIANKKCFILLGINESGKSNILDAISLLDKSIPVNYATDCNTDLENENISIVYELGISDINYYYKKFAEHGLDQHLVNSIIINKIERKIDINKNNIRSDYFHIYINSSKIFENFVIKEEKIIAKDEANLEIDEAGKVTNILDNSKLEEYLEDNFFDIFELSTPKVIFWRYEPKYLINKVIDLNIFKEDVSTSIPLKNIFRIAGFEDIKAKIDSIVGIPTKIEKLQDEIAKAISKHINDVWKEHKIEIKIRIDNMQLSFLVTDKDNSIPKYEVNQRSDGFRHFVSLLLNLSIENKIKKLTNKIILIDEPEIHLHPSGERFLRDELLNISTNNVVFFATHSVFMVDKDNLERHFSVKKEKGVTIISQIEKDNPYKEEVLYEALGTSILEHIHDKVLLVEGKTDRDIFDLYSRKFKKELKPINISTISVDGCKNAIKYTKFFNRKIVKGFVLFDSDKDGIIAKEQILKEDNYNNNNVFGINDVLSTAIEATLEDLFDKKFIQESVKEIYDLSVDIENSKPQMDQVAKKLQENRKLFRDHEKESLKDIFFKKISRLTKEELKAQKYYSFYEKLQIRIK